jgi:hypothetical protein
VRDDQNQYFGPGIQLNFVPIEFLDAVLEHGAVAFAQDVLTDMDPVVGVYAKNVLIVGSVVDLAERESVRYDRRAPLIRIRDDVGGIQ